jgi:TetR/AcrR family transcriptional repressor of nem operon
MRTAKREPKGLREKILKAAAPLLKQRGTEGAPVDAIMKGAGLTSGALYSHFENKDDLCTQAICGDLDRMLDAYGAIVREQGKSGLKRIVADYLSPAHLSGVAGGCTFAALGSDMAKADPHARRAFEERIQAQVEIFAGGLDSGSAPERRAKSQQILSTMLGALTYARAMGDARAAVKFLGQVKKRVLRDLEERP